MNVQEQLTKLEAASDLDLSAVKEEILGIMRETQGEVAALVKSATIQDKCGHSGLHARSLACELERSATDKVRGIVFGAFLHEYGFPNPTSSVLFNGTAG